MALLTAPASAYAADWAFDPRLSVSGAYNDNNRLTDVPGEEIDVAGAKIDALIAIRAMTPRSSLSFTPRLRLSIYPGDPEEESDDEFLRLLVNHSWTRAIGSIDVNYSRIDTLGDYFPASRVGEDEEIGNPDLGEGIGRTNTRNREDKLTVSPAVSFRLNPRNSLDLRAEYVDSTYDKQVPGDRVDFSYLGGAIALVTALSETSRLSIRSGYSSYDPSDGDETSAVGVDVVWDRNFSETARTYVRGGATRVEVAPEVGGEGSDWEYAFTGGVGVRWAFEVTDIWVDVTRNLDPNSSGDLVSRDQIRAEIGRRVSPRTRLSVAGRVINDSAANSDESFTERTYVSVSLAFEWRFASRWALFGAYDYTQREYKNASTNAQSNAINLGLVYEPNRR